NASLYDGASALAEACLMAVRANRRIKSTRVLVPATLHPHYLHVARTITEGQGLTFDVVPFKARQGTLDFDALEPRASGEYEAVVIQQPNFFGLLEDVHEITDWAHARGALVIAVVNPLSLAILAPPGEWGEKGVDIVVGDGQPLGVPLSW